MRLEVVAPPEVPSFPFKAGDVRRIMDLQASEFWPFWYLLRI